MLNGLDPMLALPKHAGALKNAGTIDLLLNRPTAGTTTENYNTNTIEPKIAALTLKILAELGLVAGDVTEIPVLFEDVGGRALALTPDLVNGAVYGSTYIAPEPFIDAFKTRLNATLPAGVTATYIDDWEVYHLKDGEVHCSSNEKTRPSRRSRVVGVMTRQGRSMR